MAMVMRWEEGVRWRLDLVFFVPSGLRLLSGISRAFSRGDLACLRMCCCTPELLSRKRVKKRRDICGLGFDWIVNKMGVEVKVVN